MTLSEELTWRGFINQTTYKDITDLDSGPISFYFGVDPSADSMTIGNLAAAMLVRHFIDHGHKAYLLVGGATGMIGDPDGKRQERNLQTAEQIAHNKASIAAQYEQVFAGQKFTLVDNYDWFKDITLLDFLRDTGKRVPMRQMLSRDFVQKRLGEDGDGISFAEFSYSLIQGYDFLHLHREYGVSLQLCGADQWGNCITGVDLTRRVTGDEVNVLSMPLIINKTTGQKFGKSEAGAIWLDPAKTTPTQFYQFWINCDDAGIEDYLKIFTLLNKDEIDSLLKRHAAQPHLREAQIRLAQEVTSLVHGAQAMQMAEAIIGILTGVVDLAEADETDLQELRKEIPAVRCATGSFIAEALVATGLATSNTEARRFIKENAVSINGQKIDRESFQAADFQNGRLLLRRGKAFKDSALVELQD